MDMVCFLLFIGIKTWIFFYISLFLLHFSTWHKSLPKAVHIFRVLADIGPLLFLVSSYAGKIINIRHLDEVISSINGWYMERGLFGMVSGLLWTSVAACVVQWTAAHFITVGLYAVMRNCPIINVNSCPINIQVSGVEILSGGMLRLQVSEAEVNNIAIRFLDRT